MKLIVHVTLWQRPQVTRIMLEGIRRLERTSPLELDIVASISPEDPCKLPLTRLIADYEIDWICRPNKPIGAKNNAILEHIQSNYKYEYVLLMGSDDLITTDFYEVYQPYIEERYYFIAPLTMWVYDTRKGKAKLFTGNSNGRPNGAGRLMHRDMVEECGPDLWKPDRNEGLDFSSQNTIMKYGYEITPVEEPVTIGLKSDTDIHPFNDFDHDEVPADNVLSLIPEKERNMIKELQ